MCGAGATTILQHHLIFRLQALTQVQAQFGSPVVKLVEAMLSLDPAGRPSADAVVSELDAICPHPPLRS